jgi:hypothetical protein
VGETIARISAVGGVDLANAIDNEEVNGKG